jgi:hypothetical protein
MNCAPYRLPFVATIAAVLILAHTFAANVHAVERIYTIVPAQSSVTVSGTVAGLSISGQGGSGSLTTSYNGTIRADRGTNSIDFLPTLGTPITANNKGNYSPLDSGASGTAPANYGGSVSLFVQIATFAGREFQAELSSGALAVDGTGMFPISTVDWNFLNNSRVAYRVTQISPTQGVESIAGQKIDLTGNGSLSVAGLMETLTLPIQGTLNLDLEGNSAVINFNGQIVATAMVPEPSGILLGLAGCAGLLYFARRRHCRK